MSDHPFHRKWGLSGFLGPQLTCRLWGGELDPWCDAKLELQPPGTCPVISEPQMAHPWRNLPEVSSTPSPSANSGETQREETMAGQVKMTPASQVPVTSAPNSAPCR